MKQKRTYSDWRPCDVVGLFSDQNGVMFEIEFANEEKLDLVVTCFETEENRAPITLKDAIDLVTTSIRVIRD